MAGVDLVLSKAIAEEGYLEKSEAAYKRNPSVLDSKTDGAGSDNYTKYSRDLWTEKYFNSSKQGVAWCAVFVSWCFYQSFGKEKALKLQCQPTKGNCGAGCSSAANYYKTKAQFYSDPQPGDQIFFYSSDGNGFGHTGIVERVTSSKVYTVEGNTSAGAKVIPNGGAVCRKSYDLNNSRIGGYGRPNWALVDDSPIDDTPYEKKEGEGMIDVVEYNAKVVATTGKTVNLRKTPSSKADVLFAVPVGSTVIVVTHENDEWARVSYTQANGVGINGYMMRKFLEKIPDGMEMPAAANDLNEVPAKLAEMQSLANRLSALINEVNNALGVTAG